MHRRGRRLSTCAGLLLVVATAAHAAPAVIDIRAGGLQDALTELARENGVDILYSADLVQGRQSPALRGRLTTERALAQLLDGSGVGYRVTSDGVFVLFAMPRREIVDTGDGAISEVLVIGRRTQNADIRRSENDIQPYKIIGPRELSVASQDSVDHFLRERLPANGQVVSPSQQVSSTGATNSAIDLRGVGQLRTLILVDGRRLPDLPSIRTGLMQSDINAIPLGAIERIETLTSTAGGIHGPTALGGVVNVVLKRDYSGADLTVVSGLSSRGDAGNARLEGRIGFSPDHGRTSVMLAGSYTAAQRLTAGQRDYARRSLERQARYNPDRFLLQDRPVDAITVRSDGGEPLRLDDGTVLNGSYTFLPLTFQGSASERAAALIANAGRLPTTPAKGMAGDDTSLIATPSTRSLLFSVRRPFGDRIEAFADGWALRNVGRAYFAKAYGGYRLPVAADAPNNPFVNAVNFNFPLPQLVDDKSVTTDIHRVTAGLIATLPRQWRLSADYTLGGAKQTVDREGLIIASGFDNALRNVASGARGQTPVTPLGDYADLMAAALTYAVSSGEHNRMTTQFSSGVVRAAGPVVDLPGGSLTMTLLGEARRERIPETTRLSTSEFGQTREVTPDRVQLVKSGYAEIRAPLLPRDTPIALARGLELQLALRRDDVRTTFPDNALSGATTVKLRATTHHTADVFTAGLRTFPAAWLMLRASAATGKSPPDMSQLQQMGIPVSVNGLTDPKRGGRFVAVDGTYLWSRNGWHDISQETGLTRSIGLVLNPSGRGGPRLSIDASRVEIKGEIALLNLSAQAVVNDETLYPGHVVREPLSPADAALGYTAGRITAVYSGVSNLGRTVAETVDFQLDWALPRMMGGETMIYGVATWQPTLRTRRRPGTAWLDRVGYRDGPLEWRGNAGVQWERGPVLLDLNAQYLDHSSPLWSPYTGTIQTTAQNQGKSYIPSRVYLDLTARRRFDFAGGHALRSLDVRFAVQNLLDTSPPIVADPSHMGYDYRGDPRRRRFELSLSGHF